MYILLYFILASIIFLSNSYPEQYILYILYNIYKYYIYWPRSYFYLIVILCNLLHYIFASIIFLSKSNPVKYIIKLLYYIITSIHINYIYISIK